MISYKQPKLISSVDIPVLNKEQLEAMRTTSGNLLIVASAGTGKTTTIVERYVHLVEHCDVSPDEIMMTTFTNKAAKDMEDKIRKRTKKIPKYLGTMHSLFLRMLREHAAKVGFHSNFTLLTEEGDKKKVLKEILEKRNIKPSKDTITYLLDRISRFKNAGILAGTLEEGSQTTEEQLDSIEAIGGEVVRVSSKIRKLAIGVYQAYQKYLRESNMMDFDDMLLFVYELLSKDATLLKHYKEKFKAIMVDEAQDLNVVQIKILDLLENNNLCLIGDDCQNIYTWRGASNELVFSFDRKHKKIVLNDNYRSTKNIISAVNNIIGSMAFKIDKQLNCTRGEGKDISVRGFFSFDDEIDFLVENAKELLKNKTKAENIAVLFRTNYLGKQIERSFRRNKIPCHLSRARGFLEREEIRDIVAFLRLKINPYSSLEFERVINLAEGVGKSKIAKLKELANKHHLPICDSLKHIGETSFNPETKQRLAKLDVLFGQLNKNPIDAFLKFFNYEVRIEKKYRDEPEKVDEKLENIETLKTLFVDYTNDDKGISAFLDSLIEMEKKEKQKDKVVLSTVHSAKGLEWRHVFLAGCNEKILPFYFDKLSKVQRDDELRLFYVAVSRAKDALTITHAANHAWRMLEPSSFINILKLRGKQ